MICQHSTKCFRALSSRYRRWTSPIRCGHLHQSNSVSLSDSGWHDPRHHVPKRHNAASFSCTFQWDYIAMLGLSGGGTGNTQTDGSKSNLPADVDFVSVDFASQPPTDTIVSRCALELSILDLTFEQEDTGTSTMARAQARWHRHSGTGTMAQAQCLRHKHVDTGTVA